MGVTYRFIIKTEKDACKRCLKIAYGNGKRGGARKVHVVDSDEEKVTLKIGTEEIIFQDRGNGGKRKRGEVYRSGLNHPLCRCRAYLVDGSINGHVFIQSQKNYRLEGVKRTKKMQEEFERMRRAVDAGLVSESDAAEMIDAQTAGMTEDDDSSPTSPGVDTSTPDLPEAPSAGTVRDDANMHGPSEINNESELRQYAKQREEQGITPPPPRIPQTKALHVHRSPGQPFATVVSSVIATLINAALGLFKR